jgi:phosphate transport system permease protein
MTTLTRNPARQARKKVLDLLFRSVCAAATILGILALVILIWQVAAVGFQHLSVDFIREFPDQMDASRSGIWPALMGTLWLMGITAALAIPLGVGAAIYLEEYAKPSRINTLLEINISNLSGVPSIVYGILGLAVFVQWMKMGPSILAGSLTMALLVLPIIIISAREALRAVPQGLRTASYGMGATKWQTMWRVVLPAATPGIMTGIILSLSRAIGEAAPLIVVGAAAYVTFSPQNVWDNYTVLPIQIFHWAQRPQEAFREISATAILVLLAVLLTMNAVAIFLRVRYGKHRAD